MNAKERPSPRVSIIVPVWNRPEEIVACLRSIVALDYPHDLMQIIVVDDASTDGTQEAVRSFRGSIPIRLIAAPTNRGPSACRNIGANVATAEILAFLDSDCRPDQAWLTVLVAAFADPSVVAVGGAVVPASDRSWLQRYEAVSHPLYRGPEPTEIARGTSADFLSSSNVLLRRSALVDAGGFDETLRQAEDVDLTWRLLERGGRILYRPAGRVAHEHLSTLPSMLSQRFRYAWADALVLHRHPDYRRRVGLSATLLLGVGALVAAAAANEPWLALLAALPAAIDFISVRSPRKARVWVGASRRLAAAYASMAHRIATVVVRYYTLPLLIIAVALLPVWHLWWTPAVFVGLCLVGAGIVEWVRRRPQLGVLLFVPAYVADTFALHLGLIVSCVRLRTVRPLRVRAVVRATAGSLLRQRPDDDHAVLSTSRSKVR